MKREGERGEEICCVLFPRGHVACVNPTRGDHKKGWWSQHHQTQFCFAQPCSYHLFFSLSSKISPSTWTLPLTFVSQFSLSRQFLPLLSLLPTMNNDPLSCLPSSFLNSLLIWTGEIGMHHRHRVGGQPWEWPDVEAGWELEEDRGSSSACASEHVHFHGSMYWPRFWHLVNPLVSATSSHLGLTVDSSFSFGQFFFPWFSL